MKLRQTLHYCKADKKTGKPLIVTDISKGSARNTARWRLDLFDASGRPVSLRCSYQNSIGKAKAQGARAVLQVWK